MRLREPVLHAAVQHLRGPRHRILLLQPRPLLGGEAGQEEIEGETGDVNTNCDSIGSPINQYLKFQTSWRVGEAVCEVRDESVVVMGEAVTYLKGEIYVERI